MLEMWKEGKNKNKNKNTRNDREGGFASRPEKERERREKVASFPDQICAHKRIWMGGTTLLHSIATLSFIPVDMPTILHNCPCLSNETLLGTESKL